MSKSKKDEKERRPIKVVYIGRRLNTKKNKALCVYRELLEGDKLGKEEHCFGSCLDKKRGQDVVGAVYSGEVSTDGATFYGPWKWCGRSSKKAQTLTAEWILLDQAAYKEYALRKETPGAFLEKALKPVRYAYFNAQSARQRELILAQVLRIVTKGAI